MGDGKGRICMGVFFAQLTCLETKDKAEKAKYCDILINRIGSMCMMSNMVKVRLIRPPPLYPIGT